MSNTATSTSPADYSITSTMKAFKQSFSNTLDMIIRLDYDKIVIIMQCSCYYRCYYNLHNLNPITILDCITSAISYHNMIRASDTIKLMTLESFIKLMDQAKHHQASTMANSVVACNTNLNMGVLLYMLDINELVGLIANLKHDATNLNLIKELMDVFMVRSHNSSMSYDALELFVQTATDAVVQVTDANSNNIPIPLGPNPVLNILINHVAKWSSSIIAMLHRVLTSLTSVSKFQLLYLLTNPSNQLQAVIAYTVKASSHYKAISDATSKQAYCMGFKDGYKAHADMVPMQTSEHSQLQSQAQVESQLEALVQSETIRNTSTSPPVSNPSCQVISSADPIRLSIKSKTTVSLITNTAIVTPNPIVQVSGVTRDHLNLFIKCDVVNNLDANRFTSALIGDSVLSKVTASEIMFGKLVIDCKVHDKTMANSNDLLNLVVWLKFELRQYTKIDNVITFKILDIAFSNAILVNSELVQYGTKIIKAP